MQLPWLCAAGDYASSLVPKRFVKTWPLKSWINEARSIISYSIAEVSTCALASTDAAYSTEGSTPLNKICVYQLGMDQHKHRSSNIRSDRIGSDQDKTAGQHVDRQVPSRRLLKAEQEEGG